MLNALERSRQGGNALPQETKYVIIRDPVQFMRQGLR